MSSEYKGASCPVCKKNFDDCKHSLDEARNHKANGQARCALQKQISAAVKKELKVAPT